MARIKRRGKAGAAKAYVTRTSAVKKLQISLADFRRLCILKGIFPREPRSRKKANKGSSAPTTFYYTKDIAYLSHEPVLKKLREHKAFAKKLSRALGRGEWGDAKSMEENKPTYRIDHIIKERYPTFIDALRDIDDALCMIFLFASLPSNSKVPPTIIENCTRLAAEWQLYVIHSRSLRKIFLSIKGVYYQAEVMDQTVTWLVPYQFTQNVPPDVDVRVMLTFLELYQTLLSFVLFKLYTDSSLLYPPPLDQTKNEGGAGVGAFSLQQASSRPALPAPSTNGTTATTVSGKDVRKTIKAIEDSGAGSTASDVEMADASATGAADTAENDDEEFVAQPSKSDLQVTETSQKTTVPLPTFKSISSLPQTLTTSLFSPYTFFLSREISRPIFEFLIRSFGGKVGWPSTSGSGSPYDEIDDSITHVVIDRPLVARKANESEEERERRLKRKYIQPQWVADCINAGKLLVEEPYAQGQTLPPHLSPFGEYEGAYEPLPAPQAEGEVHEGVQEEIDEDSSSDEEDEKEAKEGADEDDEEEWGGISSIPADSTPAPAPAEARVDVDIDPQDESALRAAELQAELAGVDYGTFQKQLSKAAKAKRKADENSAEAKGASDGGQERKEEEMNKMLMSNRQRKLYEKMKYTQKKRGAEKDKLEKRKKDIEKEKRRAAKAG